MVLRFNSLTRLVSAMLGVLVALPSFALADSAPRPSEVTLALKDYLELVQSVEGRERERSEREKHREPNVAQVVAQRTAVVFGADEASVEQTFEVVVQGVAKAPIALPIAGLARETRVERLDGAGSTNALDTPALDGQEGAVRLLAVNPGRFRVTVRGRIALPLANGVRALQLAPVLAPVAEATFDLPGEVDWNCAGAVPVEGTATASTPNTAGRTAAGRQHLRLALPRGARPIFQIRRKGDNAEANELLAQAVTLTLFQLLPDGPRRFDIVLYDVARGGLGAMDVELPAGLLAEQVITDEGEALPTLEGRALHLDRKQRLRGTGYLMVASTPKEGPGARLAIGGLRPAIDVRARYLVLSSTVAAEASPLPEAAWSRVDLEDLPPTLRAAVGGLELLASWRRTDETADAGSGELAVVAAPPANLLETVVRTRETTTLLTPDGTLLIRDRFALAQAGEALRVALAPGSTLWSARVGEQAVRPLQQSGVLVIPLGLASLESEVEVVSVLEKAIPAGRSRLLLTAPEVQAPVLEHRWRVLLPENARYRYAGGELRPVAAELAQMESELFAAGAVKAEDLAKVPSARDPWAVLQKIPNELVDRINVGGRADAQQETITVTAESPVLDERQMGNTTTFRNSDLSSAEAPTKRNKEKDARESGDLFRQQVAELKQGLVGGVRPLPVAVPESGKALLLSGVLPPAHVTVEIEVKGKK
ncbi:MAG: hypothetical protein ABI609_01780 [Acidobacteriota bacterium]